jgi:molybdopterin-guanine dinucleotide biosynthesis protein MobB
MMAAQKKRLDILARLPVLGVCGWSGSGKTTLIETAMPHLLARNLKVAVVKHDVHGIDVDRPGKDSDRFFQAGADVFLQGNEELARLHPDPAVDLVGRLIDLARGYDLVLVEGHKQSPLPKVWLLHEGESGPPANITDVMLILPRNAERAAAFIAFLTGWLTTQRLKTPVYGCICVGGGERGGKTEQQLSMHAIKRLDNIRQQLLEYTEKIVVVGYNGMVAGCDDCLQLPRSPGASGPLAGILTAMRWYPLASWLTADMGSIDSNYWQRALAQRAPGVWAILPADDDDYAIKAYPAYYDFRAVGLLEDMVNDHDFLLNLAAHPKSVRAPCSRCFNES